MGNKKLVHAVADLVKLRAYIFICSYETAWENWLHEDEKQGFIYEKVKVCF